MKVKSFVGGHDIIVYTGCEYSEKYRKYVGGELLTVIPYSGRMLSAVVKTPDTEKINLNGVEIPVNGPQKFIDIDPIPSPDECDYCVVSAMYVAACKALGIDTSRLLTIGGPVVNESGQVIGTNLFNKN